MIIRLKKKGKVVDFQLLCENRGVDSRLLRKGFDGIDMTAYSVISARVKSFREAEELFVRFGEKLPVVYYFDRPNGFGSGVLLPENFDPSRVKHFAPVEKPKNTLRVTRRVWATPEGYLTAHGYIEEEEPYFLEVLTAGETRSPKIFMNMVVLTEPERFEIV